MKCCNCPNEYYPISCTCECHALAAEMVAAEDEWRERVYEQPAITHELPLETRAGSPQEVPPVDPLNDIFVG